MYISGIGGFPCRCAALLQSGDGSVSTLLASLFLSQRRSCKELRLPPLDPEQRKQVGAVRFRASGSLAQHQVTSLAGEEAGGEVSGDQVRELWLRGGTSFDRKTHRSSAALVLATIAR